MRGTQPEFRRGGCDVTQHGTSEQLDSVLLDECLQGGVSPVVGDGVFEIFILQNLPEEVRLDGTYDGIVRWGRDRLFCR